MPGDSVNVPASRSLLGLQHLLLAGYALLIVYASLSPFSGWREQGLEFSEIMAAQLWRHYTLPDVLANVLAYIPLGLLAALSLYGRLGRVKSSLLAIAASCCLSAAMEYTQMYLPSRNSANLDVLANATGALIGALTAAWLAPSPWFGRLGQLRQKLFRFDEDADFGMALFILWMFAQINPALPMLGNIFVSDSVRQPFQAVIAPPFNWLSSFSVMLNMLMLGCLLITLMRHRRHAVNALMLVVAGVAFLKFIAAALLLKSWALLLWLTSEAMLGVIAGLILLAISARLHRRRVYQFAAVSAVAYLITVFSVPEGGAPPANLRLYHWHEGHLLTYNGLSYHILLLFPLLLLAFLWRTRKH